MTVTTTTYRHRQVAAGLALAVLGSMLAVVSQPVPVQAAPVSHTNSGPITIPLSGPATPYPSTISVSGSPACIVDVDVRLNGLSHTFPDDVDVLLVGPTGAKTLVMSDAGGDPDVANVNLTFDNEASASLPNNSLIGTGTYRPSNYGGMDVFASPAPAGPYPESLGVFDGTDPNGIWNLYVIDDNAQNQGSISGGWTLLIDAATCQANLRLVKADTPDPVVAGANLTYSITISNQGPNVATNVVLNDTVPTGTNFVSIANPSGFPCPTQPSVGGTGAISCTGPTLATGAANAKTFTLVVKVDASTTGTVSNTASVNSSTTDPAPANNSDTETTSVTSQANLGVDKSCTPTTVVPGTAVDCTLTVTNAGPSDAQGVTVTDNLSEDVTLVDTPGGGGFTCAAASSDPEITCTRATVPAGTPPLVIAYSAVVDDDLGPETNIINTATVTSTTADPVAPNNTETFTVATPTCTIDRRNSAFGGPLSPIFATEGPDVICGSAFGDVINAKGGDDVVFGLGGTDVVDGGPGNDAVFGGDANDSISGADDDDILVGNAGSDSASGGAGTDACMAESETACES